MIALRPIPKKVEPLMLAAAIASRETQIFLDQRTTGMAESQVNFENSVLLSAPISLPSIEEQSAISGICSDFDKEIRDLESKIDSLRSIKEGMMQQLLTGKIRLI
jgi:type I restriction enzyme S subunit